MAFKDNVVKNKMYNYIFSFQSSVSLSTNFGMLLIIFNFII